MVSFLCRFLFVSGVAPEQVAIVRIAGEIDIARENDVVSSLLQSTGDVVEADLADVTFIDSSGLRALLRAAGELGAEGRRLRCVNPSSAVLKLLTMTRV